MPILVLLTSMPNGIEFLQGKEPPPLPAPFNPLLLHLFVDVGRERRGRERTMGEDMR